MCVFAICTMKENTTKYTLNSMQKIWRQIKEQETVIS